ncbi:hypothetical protein PGB90_006900 [Kerria lacca]
MYENNVSLKITSRKSIVTSFIFRRRSASPILCQVYSADATSFIQFIFDIRLIVVFSKLIDRLVKINNT